jgi:hypothetical protein
VVVRFSYTAEQRRAIQKELPPGADVEAELETLEKSASAYLSLSRQRARYFTSKGKLQGREFIGQQEQSLNTDKLAGHYKETARLFSGRRNLYRELLFDGVLYVWTRLGGKLAVSTAPNGGRATGPLLRFFLACVGPVLKEQTPSPHSVWDIIERQRKGRENLDRAKPALKRLAEKGRSHLKKPAQSAGN